jgi:hypothetical protein
MYVSHNPKSKAQLKRDLKSGMEITLFSPGLGLEPIPTNGTVYLKGPHFPKPHKWYGQGTMKDGKLVKVT